MARLAIAVALVLACLGTYSTVSACQVLVNSTAYVDLTPISLQNWFATGNSPYNYLLNPCKTLTYDAVQMPEGNAFCNDTARVCQITSTGPAFLVGNQYLATSTGTTTTVTISGGSYCQNLGVYRKAVINFSCGTTLGSPTLISDQSCTYTFSWTSSAACPKAGQPGDNGGGSSTGLSGGDVFLIIFFIGGFLYVAIGYAYMYRFKEARGVEAVPNIAFWRELPGLLKDGCVYTWGKIKGIGSKN